MYSTPKHSAARERRPLRSRFIGFAIAAAATLVTGVGVSPPAHAAASVWDRVAACESGGRWAVNTGNGYYGGLQFSASTWKRFGGTRYASSASRASKSVQIAIAQRVLAAQGPGAWPVCGQRAGLTRAGGVARAATVSRSRARVAIHAKLRVDGRMGPQTVRALQRWCGIAQSGVFRAATIKAMQRRVGVRADGVLGSRTIRALQVRINAHRDGARRLNPATVAALQGYLNRH